MNFSAFSGVQIYDKRWVCQNGFKISELRLYSACNGLILNNLCFVLEVYFITFTDDYVSAVFVFEVILLKFKT